MDLSENYTSMCSKAEEIQDRWTPRHGDHLANYQSEWLDVDDNTRIREISFKDHVMLGVDNVSITNRTLCAWLPKQDQLQNILSDNRTLTMLISDFHWWVGTSNRKNGKEKDYLEFIGDEDIVDITKVNNTSMEQLWLKYVMVVKYKKRWNGKDWIKS